MTLAHKLHRRIVSLLERELVRLLSLHIFLNARDDNQLLINNDENEKKKWNLLFFYFFDVAMTSYLSTTRESWTPSLTAVRRAA